MMYQQASAQQNAVLTRVARAQGIPAVLIGLMALVVVAALATLFMTQAHVVGNLSGAASGKRTGATGSAQSAVQLTGYADGAIVSLSGRISAIPMTPPTGR